MTDALPDPKLQQVAETSSHKIIRSRIVPVAIFIAGIGSTLLTQSFVGHQQLMHAKRDTRVAALRDYAGACYGEAVQLSELANLPLHLRAIWVRTDLTQKERGEQMVKMSWESVQNGHKASANLEVQAQIVNAIFDTKVDPIGVIVKDVPVEFKALPGETNPDELIARVTQDPVATLKQYAPMLGRDSVALSRYCAGSVHALSLEIE